MERFCGHAILNFLIDHFFGAVWSNNTFLNTFPLLQERKRERESVSRPSYTIPSPFMQHTFSYQPTLSLLSDGPCACDFCFLAKGAPSIEWTPDRRFLRLFSASRIKSLPPKSCNCNGGVADVFDGVESISCLLLMLSTGSISCLNIKEMEPCKIPAIFWSKSSLSLLDRKGDEDMVVVLIVLIRKERKKEGCQMCMNESFISLF